MDARRPYPRLVAFFVVLLACALALSSPLSAKAAFPGGNGKIAVDDGDYDVATFNPDGSDWRFLAGGGSPAWSPDGLSIAYSGCGNGGGEQCGLYVMDYDGIGQHLLPGTIGLRGPAWSPSGRRLVAANDNCDPDSNCGLYLVNRDGTSLNYLPSSASRFAEPAWSPTGGKVAYGGTDPTLGEGVYVIDTDGTGERRLTTGGHPDWSPDGRRITFEDGGWILVMNADGSRQQRIAQGLMPVWSPDGQWILIRPDQNGFTGFVRVHPDGSGFTRIPTLDSGWPGGWQASSPPSPPEPSPTPSPVAGLPPSVTSGPAPASPITVVVGSAQAPQSPTVTTEGAPEAALVIQSRSLRRLLRRHKLVISIVTSEAARIRLRLTTRAGVVVARGTRLVPAGKVRTVTLRLTRRGARALRRARSAHLTLRGTLTDVQGHTRSLSHKLILRYQR